MSEVELPILLGEAPSKSGDRYHMVPLSGAVAETLCKLAGIPPQAEGTRYGQWTWALYEHFECHNLIKRYPGPLGRGAALPLYTARPLAVTFAEKNEGRVIVVLGARLKSLFTIVLDNYIWHDAMVTIGTHGEVHKTPCQIVAIPHPSGLNRMMNDQGHRDRSGQVLREAMTRVATIT